ncbi:hypothetical protein PVAP13_7KG025000 [Panicum virgatum]|uniref:Uncharacterized protein n=1 Tax=Panicum virgatum TaxID=38727 RepID=A0A8T0Q7X7_PANVG|nr:hypothetical protein PVAP13_7KG025000 [Panicum virgatum]
MAVWLAHHPSASKACVTPILRPVIAVPPWPPYVLSQLYLRLHQTPVQPRRSPRPGLCPDEQPPLRQPHRDEPQPAPCRYVSSPFPALVRFSQLSPPPSVALGLSVPA